MIKNPIQLINDFLHASGDANDLSIIQHELLLAPHIPKSLPVNKCAIYVFSISQFYGEIHPVGANRILKVGKVGPKSNARFLSQHYNPKSAKSTLAGSIIRSKILWSFLGFERIDENSIKDWLLAFTDRDHFYLDEKNINLLDDLEVYLRAHLGPVFEG
ncbi:hypothetical protein [Brevibacillus sp. SYSU BS000544]|uniref:hypothetical protein n=1 Tax=Brevibacillus sp. SYSU BS000544 TaxID=3416443 RepID=UPI003CE4528D